MVIITIQKLVCSKFVILECTQRLTETVDRVITFEYITLRIYALIQIRYILLGILLAVVAAAVTFFLVFKSSYKAVITADINDLWTTALSYICYNLPGILLAAVAATFSVMLKSCHMAFITADIKDLWTTALIHLYYILLGILLAVAAAVMFFLAFKISCVAVITADVNDFWTTAQ